MYKLIDLFAGAGGISVGFEWAGFETVFANEFDKNIAESFKYNFPKTPLIVDDIRNLNFTKIKAEFNIQDGDIDVIAGGPPCQGFSMANRKRIENDERNLLFLEFVRAVEVFQPKCFLIENVMGMKSESISIGNRDRNIVDSMTSFFKDLGYQIAFKSFKAEEQGVPQIRRRVIIIGTRLKDKISPLSQNIIGNVKKKYLSKSELFINSNQIHLFDEDICTYLNPTTVWDAISDLPLLNDGEGMPKMEYKTPPQNEYQKLMREKSTFVENHITTPHSKAVLERIGHIKQGENFNQLPDELKTKSCHSGAYGRLVANSLSPTITTRFDTPSTGRVIHPFENRTLTVREAARLQSFPDNYTFIGTRTSQGKQVGNAVPPLVAKSIAEMFINDFLTTNSNGNFKCKSKANKAVI